MANENNDQPSFIKHVFSAELDEIKARRTEVGKSTDKLEGGPSTTQQLTGLAISGGGIRSATFSLGVIQELARQGILKSTDYLSTVSGGGYTGSCLSSLLNHPKRSSSGDGFPLKYTTGFAEEKSLTHLRNSSNYLTPKGLLNTLRLPNILLRGIILNLFVFMPFIMVAVFFTEVAYEKGPALKQLATWILPLVAVFVFMSVLFPLAMRTMRQFFNWQKRNLFELSLTIPLLIALIILLLIPILNLTTRAIEYNTAQVFAQFQGWFSAQSDWLVAVACATVLAIFMLSGRASNNATRLSGKLLITLIGLLGPAIIFGIYLALCLWQIDSPYLPSSTSITLNKASDCEQACLTTDPEFQSFIKVLESRSISLSDNAVIHCQSGDCKQTFDEQSWQNDKRVWVINDAPQEQALCPKLAQISPFDNAGVVGNCHYFSRDSKNELVISGNQLHLLESKEDYLFVALLLSLLIFNRFFLDMNIISPHGFYRDRLSKAYLIRLDDDGNVIHDDQVKLSELNSPGTQAPYHLINVALNLQASKAADLRCRKSDFFIFSKHFIGSLRTGFTATKQMEEYDKHMDLATAMAISGGAAAPNMGTSPNRSLVFIMTLLNIRLGYWLPNPKRINSKHWYHRFGLKGAKPNLIWREALGKLDEFGSHVNLSDGGHIENLGLYPLLQRQCKYIVSIDGEADPNMTFDGLVKLMRFARIDMGIEIDIDLGPLRKNEAGNSLAHSVLGTIRYGNGEEGKLLYIKLSVLGDEPEYINAYRAEHPQYPHEPTSDQFFTEDQFEAYRALGEYACKNTLNNTKVTDTFKDLLEPS